MITRDKVLGQAVDQCMKDLYSLATPKVNWNQFIQDNKDYLEREKILDQYRDALHNKEANPEKWEEWNNKYPDWIDKSRVECIGPKPYEFYFLPREIMKSICDDYVYAYNIDTQKHLLNTIQILKDYCKEPIVDKWIEGENGNPGHRGYAHPKNLKEQIKELLGDIAEDNDYYPNRICEKFFEFLDMAGKFYNWNRDLNSFNMSVYLGASPNSNKKAVIENWKKYKGVDIEIDEEQMIKDYYGDDE